MTFYLLGVREQRNILVAMQMFGWKSYFLFNDKHHLFDVVSYMTCCIEEGQQIVECYQTVE